MLLEKEMAAGRCDSNCHISKNGSIPCIFVILLLTAVFLYLSMFSKQPVLRNPRPLSGSKPLLSQNQSSHTEQLPVVTSQTILSEELKSSTEQSERASNPQQHKVTSMQHEASHHSGQGYFFALHFSDQGTGAFLNILTFLCFASELGGVRIVEPFLVKSVFGQNVSANWTRETKFSDVFDSDKLNKFAISKNYKPLVPYDTFLKDAPRKLIIAHMKCSGLESCRPCGHEDVLEKGRIFSKMNGFEMVGHVCLNFGSNGRITLKEIEKELYGTYSKSEVVVMFPRFGGVDGGKFSKTMGYRLFLSSSSCYRSKLSQLSLIRPSRLVESTATKYMNTYLNGQRYISVMVRMEMILRSKLRTKEAPHLTERCLNTLYQTVERIKTEVGISQVFLCLDVGRYGTLRFHSKEYMEPILPYFDSFVSRTIKEGMTLSEWDSTFSTSTPRQDPGFVAVMQKVIAARGDVLVLLGAESSFQSSTRDMYNSLHKDKKVYKLKVSCGL